MAYQRIIFLEGENAAVALQILRQEGVQAACTYLEQWDYGDRGEQSQTVSYGNGDHVQTHGDYQIFWNTVMDYIGLERIIRD